MTTALLVIDVQKVYTGSESELYCEDSKGTVERINRLIQNFQEKEAPIFLIRHVHKADGSDLGRMFDFAGEAEEDFNFKEDSDEVDYDDALIKPAAAIEIRKNRYSAFVGTDLGRRLEKKNIQRVVICGFMTNFCCESTARDAHDRDYFVDLVIDATGTPGTDNIDEEKMRYFVGECMENGIACVMSTEEYLNES